MANEAGAALARLLSNVAKYSVALGLGGSALQASLYNVDGGERAVIFDRFRGVLPETTGEVRKEGISLWTVSDLSPALGGRFESICHTQLILRLCFYVEADEGGSTGPGASGIRVSSSSDLASLSSPLRPPLTAAWFLLLFSLSLLITLFLSPSLSNLVCALA
jgi:hypothetical protein